jgi:hypothetical protein
MRRLRPERGRVGRVRPLRSSGRAGPRAQGLSARWASPCASCPSKDRDGRPRELEHREDPGNLAGRYVHDDRGHRPIEVEVSRRTERGSAARVGPASTGVPAPARRGVSPADRAFAVPPQVVWRGGAASSKAGVEARGFGDLGIGVFWGPELTLCPPIPEAQTRAARADTSGWPRRARSARRGLRVGHVDAPFLVATVCK